MNKRAINRKSILTSRLTAEQFAKDMYAGFRLAGLVQILCDVFEGVVRDMYGHLDRSLYAYSHEYKRRITFALAQARQSAATFREINRYIYDIAKGNEQHTLISMSDYINDMLLPFYPFGAQDEAKVRTYLKSFADCMKDLQSINKQEKEEYADILNKTQSAFREAGL